MVNPGIYVYDKTLGIFIVPNEQPPIIGACICVLDGSGQYILTCNTYSDLVWYFISSGFTPINPVLTKPNIVDKIGIDDQVSSELINKRISDW